MKKRIILIVIVLLLLGGAAGGIFLYVRRNTGFRLLARAEVALKAEKFSKAAGLAKQYIGQKPGDWRGHQFLGQAYLRLGRFDEAYKAFEAAGKVAPTGEVAPELAMVDTIAHPARQTVGDAYRRMPTGEFKATPTGEFTEAIANIEKANTRLEAIKTDRADRMLDAKRRIGLNCKAMAAGWTQLAARLQEEVRTAEDTHHADAAAQKRRDRAEALNEARDAMDRAIVTLLAVVRQDPSRSLAARDLVDVCIASRGTQRMDEVSRVITDARGQLPIAAMRLERHRLTLRAAAEPPEHRRKHWMDFATVLDGLLAESPDKVEIRLARVEASLEIGDTVEARGILDDMPDADKRGHVARLLQVRIMMAEEAAKPLATRDYSAARTLAVTLTNERPLWAEAHYYSALVADAGSRSGPGDPDAPERKALAQAARRAMRRVVQISPGNFAARRFLVETLVDAGFHDKALEDARECHHIHPESPTAIAMLFEAALNTNQPGLAQRTLVQAQRDCGTDPRVLDVVIQGYNALAQRGHQADAMREASQAALRKIAACEPQTIAGRLVIAEAMVALGRGPEAEKILLDGLERSPDQPQLHYVLGRVDRQSGRILQAIDHFKAAVRLDGEARPYRLELAGTLLDSGDLASAEAVIAPMDPGDVDVNLLRFQISLAKGESGQGAETVRRSTDLKQAGRALALIYFNSGRFRQCAEVCLAELSERPKDHGMRLLLANAYRRLGEPDKGLQELTSLLASVPDQMSIYQQIATILATDQGLADVEKALRKLPEAKPEIVDLTLGWLAVQKKDFAFAMGAYDRLIARSDAKPFYRNRARLLRAGTLPQTGQIGRALAELDALAKVEGWDRTALAAKAELLIHAGRAKEAKAELGRLSTLFVAQADVPGLLALARSYLRLEATDEALAACEHARKALPADTRPYLLRASILASAGQDERAITALDQALALKPSDVDAQLAKARMLDRLHRPRQALDALDRAAKIGQAGRAKALFERARLLASWGLSGPAAEALVNLARSRDESMPGINLMLGQSLAALGDLDEARKRLENVSKYSAQYIEARQLLSRIVSGTEAKLKVLDDLDAAKPGRSSVLVQRMVILLNEGKPAQALKAFNAFVGGRVEEPSQLSQAHLLALACMFETGDTKRASEFARRVVQQRRWPGWRATAAMVTLDVDPAAAAQVLGQDAAGANLSHAMLGLAIAVCRNDAIGIRTWGRRVNRITDQLGTGDPRRRVPARYVLLAGLATGDAVRTRKALDAFEKSSAMNRAAADELVRNAPQDSGARVEAARLLRASLAGEAGLRAHARRWAMGVLSSRPRCQWAAALAFGTRPSADVSREILDSLQPKDCTTARIIQASLFDAEGKYAQAAEVYRLLGETHPNDIGIMLGRATAMEKDGRLDKALALYREIQRERPHPVAANNGAYLVTQVSPQDAKAVREAFEWMDKTVKGSPRMAAFRETRGWLAFLLGKKDQARADIRQAIKGLVGVPDAHYHLGVVEADAGDAELAKWHYQAAVSSVNAMEARGQAPAAAEKRAAELAAKALAEIARPPTTQPGESGKKDATE